MRLTTSIGAVLLSMSVSVCANGFKVNETLEGASKQLGILLLSDLSLGEKATVRQYEAELCTINGELKISSGTKVSEEFSKYTDYLTIKRTPNDRFEITPSNKGDSWDDKDLIEFVTRMFSLRQCSNLQINRSKFYSVTSVMKSSNLKELVNKVSSFSNVSKSSKKRTNKPVGKTEAVFDDWLVSDTVSPIDDSQTVSMTKFSTSKKEMLVLRCKEGQVDAFVNVNNYMADNSTVTLRFDSETAAETIMSMSTDSKALFFRQPVETINKLSTAQKLVFRYQPYNEGYITTSFTTTNINESLPKFKAACQSSF